MLPQRDQFRRLFPCFPIPLDVYIHFTLPLSES